MGIKADNRVGLSYTGISPFLDNGIATMTVMSDKQHPEELTYEDLEAVADRLKVYFCDPEYKPIQNYVSTIFTNSHFVQPAKKPEDKRQYAAEVLYAFRQDTPPLEDGSSCTFFPKKPAVMYATRQHIPLLNGATISNFSPKGGRGIPVCGEVLLAIHAMPFGSIKCGNLLLMHQTRYWNDPSEDMNILFAWMALELNRKVIHFIRQGGIDRWESLGSSPKTRYVETILRAQQELREEGVDPFGNTNITGYYFTNYGPKPDLEILQLDSTILRFIDAAQHEARSSWQAVQRRGWIVPKGEDDDPTPEKTLYWRNEFYESLFSLPHDAHKFLTYLKGHWQLIEVFLKEVMQMKEFQIDMYKTLGDKLAQYMIDFQNGSWSLYKRLRTAYPSEFRIQIQRIREDYSYRGYTEPHITTDEFILAFEHPDNANVSYWLARDVIVMRMFDRLHEEGWTMSNEDLIEESKETRPKEK